MKTTILISFILCSLLFGICEAQGIKNISSETPKVFTQDHPGHNAFSFNATSISSSTLQKYDLGTPGIRTTIGSSHSYFFGAADFAPLGGVGTNYVFYTANQLPPYNFFRIDTITGTETPLPNITGITSGSLTDIAWDGTTNTMFAVTTTTSSSQLYSLNVVTGVAVPIGAPITNAPFIPGITCALNGTLFAYDAVNDAAYRINKTTGAASLIGPLGFNAGDGDCAFDLISGTWYLVSSGYLWICDTTTGNCTSVGFFTGAAQMMGTGIPARPPVGVIHNQNEIPSSYSLEQNYPNPFNPTTFIRCQLPVSIKVSIVIYDILGREIEMLVNEQLKAGTYEVEWDATNYPSGVYYYRLTAGDFIETKRMVLLK